MPIPYTFMARNSQEIEKHFLNDSMISKMVYVIMAQPLNSSINPFCLTIFGTDNHFTTKTVVNRWEFIITKCEEVGIRVLGVSADGDARLLKAMKIKMQLGAPTELEFFTGCKFFNCFSDPVINPHSIQCVQDTIHIITKFRNRLLRSSTIMPIGTKIINISHIKYLITNVSKDKHLLTEYDINPKDRQNFKSASKIYNNNTIMLLNENVPDSNGTQIYLKIMQFVASAFLDDDILPIKRIYNIWYAVFMLRIWRKYIDSHTDLNTRDNFITENCYTCVELNAHSLVNLAINLRESNQCELFLPTLFSSQPCEGLFRQIRSMSSTFSTVVNSSMLDILHRVKRLHLQSEIISTNNSDIVFPRFEKKKANSDF